MKLKNNDGPLERGSRLYCNGDARLQLVDLCWAFFFKGYIRFIPETDNFKSQTRRNREKSKTKFRAVQIYTPNERYTVTAVPKCNDEP